MTARRLADPVLVPFLLILVVFGWIHDTKLAAFFGLAQIPRCERPHVKVISCPNAPRDRAANAQRLISSSPYPAELVPCVDAPGGAIASSPHSQLNKAERSLFQSHLHAIASGLQQLGDDDGCLLVLEDDAVVDWSVIARVVEGTATLGEPWDVMNLHNKRWEGARSWWMTDRAFRGCASRPLRHETFGSTFAHTNRRNPLDEDERPPHQHRRNASSLRRG